MKELRNDEYEALLSLPEFQTALLKVRADKKAKKEAEEARRNALSQKCEGADPIREKTGFRCPKCDIFLAYTDNANENRNHEILLGKRHWHRRGNPGANPFTESGLYGKAAAAAEGDWYGSH